MSFRLALDFGTSFTAAAAFDGRNQPEAIGLQGPHARLLPSAVLLEADGSILVGSEAVNSGGLMPDRLLRCPKREIGHSRALLGGDTVNVDELVGAVLREVYRRALRERAGQPPDSICLTHPVAWTENQIARLTESAVLAGFGEVELIAEPIAAATYLAGESRNGSGGTPIAVYDLGGGTFDACVLRLDPDGRHEIMAHGGIDPLGGEDFDESIIEHLAVRLCESGVDLRSLVHPEPGDEQRGLIAIRIREEVVRAKEALSESNSYTLLLGYDVRYTLTRDELEELLREPIDRTTRELLAVVASAGQRPSDLGALYLTGGSSRIPLIAERIADALGLERPPATLGDPKLAVALGAAKHDTNGHGGKPPRPPAKEKQLRAMQTGSHVVVGHMSGPAELLWVKSEGEAIEVDQMIAALRVLDGVVTIAAPVSGTVGAVHIEKGEAVLPGTTLFDLRSAPEPKAEPKTTPQTQPKRLSRTGALSLRDVTWELLLIVALAISVAIDVRDLHTYGSVEKISEVGVLAGVFAVTVWRLRTRSPRSGVACALAAAVLAGWQYLFAQPLAETTDVIKAGLAIGPVPVHWDDWGFLAAAMLALGCALGLSLDRQDVRRITWCVRSAPRDPALLLLGVGGALGVGSTFLPYLRSYGADYNIWDWSSGISDLQMAALFALLALLAIVIAAARTPRRALPWTIALVAAITAGDTITPGYLDHPSQVRIGYWLLVLATVLVVTGSARLWVVSKRAAPL